MSCRTEDAAVVAISPNHVSVDDLPVELSVEGRSLKAMVRISISDTERVQVAPIEAHLGVHQVQVLRHPSAERMFLEAPRGLTPGTYDLTLVVRDDTRLVVPAALVVTSSEQLISGSEPMPATTLFASDANQSSATEFNSTDTINRCVGLDFEAPERLTILGFDVDSLWSPTFGRDPSTMYFAATVDGEESLWRARRTGEPTTFSEPTKVATEFQQLDVGTPFVNDEGSTLYVFANGLDSLGERDLYALSGSGVDFPRSRHLAELNSSGRDHLPWISRDESWIIFASDRSGDSEDLWSAKRPTEAAVFDAPTPLASLNSSSNEGRSFVTSDGLTAVFASNREGSLGDYDLWSAVRASTQNDFGDVRNLTELNTERRDFDVTFTPDEREVFFAREEGSAMVLFRALRRCSL